MEAKELTKVTIEEYLKIEQQEQIRYEYHDGYVQAMAGETLNHGLISGNTFAVLNAKLLQKKAQIEIYERSESSELWRIKRVIGLEETLYLNSLKLDISLKEIYRNVVFEE